jgi:hypothetical protein
MLLPVEKLFTTREVTALANVPTWYLAKLVTSGALCPVWPGRRGSGCSRLFSFEQLVAVAFAGQLRAARVTSDGQRDACRWVSTNPGEIRLPAAIGGVVTLESVAARVYGRVAEMLTCGSRPDEIKPRASWSPNQGRHVQTLEA